MRKRRVRKASQVQIHIVVKGGVSNDSPNAGGVTVIGGDDVYWIIRSSCIGTVCYHLRSYLSSTGIAWPHVIICQSCFVRYDDSSFVGMVGEEFDIRSFFIKEERVWLAIRIRIALNVD